MTITDPRTTLKSAYDANITKSNITKEDGANAKLFPCQFDWSQQNLSTIFKKLKYDATIIVAIDRIEPINTPSGPRGYRFTCKVDPWVIAKRASTTTMDIVAANLLWKLVDEILRVTRTYVTGSASRMVMDGRQQIENLGGTILYHFPLEVVVEEYA